MNARRLLVSLAIVIVAAGGLAACSGDAGEVATGAGGEGGTSTSTTPVTNPGEVVTTTEPIVVAGEHADALDDARRRWSNSGIADYDYEFTTSCECGPETSGPNTVRVRNGEVVDVEYQGMNIDRQVRTVDEYFDSIAAAIASGVEIDVTYDDETGRPLRVFLDTEAMAADGGDGTELIGFVALDGFRDDLDDARLLWHEAMLDDYSIDHSPVCFCPIEDLITKVVGGQVASTVVAGTDQAPGFAGWSMTVIEMFDEIEQAFDTGAASITALYDPELGFPSEYYVDVESNMADEEFGMVVRGVAAS